jgi:hypothetical protein
VYTEEQRHFIRFLWVKGLSAKNIHKEIFPLYGGKCLSCKAVHNWVERFSDEEDETDAEVAERTDKDFYAAGFDALVKRWDKCIKC